MSRVLVAGATGYHLQVDDDPAFGSPVIDDTTTALNYIPATDLPTRPHSRRRATFACAECGWASPRWVGRCGQCQAWGTVGEPGAERDNRMIRAASEHKNPTRRQINVHAS